MHEKKLFTLYNIASCENKKTVLSYVQQRRDQTAKEKNQIICDRNEMITARPRTWKIKSLQTQKDFNDENS